jgi:ribonuclease G
MPSELVINVTSGETRVALLEHGNLVELYIERHGDRSIVGDIYKGRVTKILPGMQACFVDIGLTKSAFLYVNDVLDSTREYSELLGLEEAIDDPVREAPEARRMPDESIEDLLSEGQELMIQVAKDPIGTKGARVTTNVSIPGRTLVLLPKVHHIGVSRRITQEKERQRLKETIERIRSTDLGIIARTAGEGCDEQELKAEMGFLVQLWDVIRNKSDKGSVPRLLYSDLDMTLRAVRDLMVREAERIVIDSPNEYLRILAFLDAYLPQYKHRVQHYDGEEPIFDAYHIEMEIARAFERKIWLKSGGYILVEETEALTSIDVNSGRYVGRQSFEETILKINLEAAKEIAYQLRLRNIGGIIIIDFIDMERDSNKEQVFQALKGAMKNDRSRTNILKISEMGLVQMTRKRVKEGITRQLGEPCPYCDGQGWVKSVSTLCYDALREIKREAAHCPFPGGEILVEAHPDVAHALLEEERVGLEELENQLTRQITIKANDQYHRDQIEVWVK